MPITPDQIKNAKLQQDTAAHDPRRQIRLVAGPGTGKSFAIQEKVYWLLNNGVPPKNIYVVSFTRASSLDLQKRIRSFCLENGLQNGDQVSVSTLHSLALRALRAANLLAYPVDPSVVDDWELKSILDAEFAKVSGYTPKRCQVIRGNYEAFCGTDQWLPPNYIPPNPPVSEAEQISYQHFHTPRTQIYSCVLPGEIVRQCVVKMRAGNLDPVQLLGIKYLIVDEYQDLNPIDLEFVDRLINSGVSSFVAGDDDQSIYSFRFASPQGIQTFIDRFPDSGDYELRSCFRCATNILRTAQVLMTEFAEPNRIPKQLSSLYTASEPAVPGIVRRWRFSTANNEARALAQSCAKLINNGIPARDIIILISNTRAQAAMIKKELENENVEFEAPKANQYINTNVGRFVLAILRIVCNSNDYVAHRLVLGLRPHVGPTTCNRISEAVITNNLNFRDIFYHPLPTGVFGGRLLSAINYARDVCSSITAWSPDDTLASRLSDISSIISTVFGQQDADEWVALGSDLPQEITIEEFRDYLWADTDERQENLLETVYTRLGLEMPEELFPQKVRLMTMHGAKGLSAKVVFIPGLEENILPGTHRQPYTGLVLEAARLLYVSITRARAACILSYAQRRIMYGQFLQQAPSRFTQSLDGAFHYQDGSGLTDMEITEITSTCQNL